MKEKLKMLVVMMALVALVFALPVLAEGQDGRELRVIVAPDLMNEVEAHETARKIRERIEESVGGSIPIKVTLIREQRFTEIAKF